MLAMFINHLHNQDGRMARQICQVVVGFILSAALCGVAAAVEPERPAWCKPGWECISTKEVADDTLQHIALHTEIIRLKAKSRHLGFTVGCGVGVAAIVTNEWDGITSPGGFCGAMYGWRF